jgi:hypothetical protein
VYSNARTAVNLGYNGDFIPEQARALTRIWQRFKTGR